MRVLTGRKYLALLVILLVFVVGFPLLRAATETRLLLDFLTSLIFLAALRAIFTDHRVRVVALLLGVPTLVGMWTGYVLPAGPRVPLAVGLHVLSALFFAFTTAVILRGIHQDAGVSADSVYGAFCGYLLTGLAFGHLYTVVELLAPGSFRGDGYVLRRPDDHHILLTYFSFVSLTTVGYGDIVPATDPARGLVVCEAIVGQFYIVVLVGELIGKRVSQAFPAPPNPPV